MPAGWVSAGVAILGAVSANQQSKDAQNMQRENLAASNADLAWKREMGQPYRDQLAQLYADPSAFLGSDRVQIPLQQETDKYARRLSTGGNPLGSGNALQALQDSTTKGMWDRFGQEADRLSGFGGLSGYNAAGAQPPQPQQYIPNDAMNQLQAGFGMYQGEKSRQADRDLWASYQTKPISGTGSTYKSDGYNY